MGGGFVVLTAAVLAILRPRSAPEPAPAEAPSVPAEAPAPAASAAPPAPSAASATSAARTAEDRDADAAASDPGDRFASAVFQGPATELINDARTRVAAEKRLPANMRMDLYRYGKENPTDARPQLLLAIDEMRLRWYDAAMEHYEKALKADPRTVDDKQVLHELVQLVTRGQKERASASIQRHYGRRAVGAIDEAISSAESGHDDRAARILEELRASL